MYNGTLGKGKGKKWIVYVCGIINGCIRTPSERTVLQKQQQLLI